MTRRPGLAATLVAAGALVASVLAPAAGASAAGDTTAPALTLEAVAPGLTIPAAGVGKVVLKAHASDAVGVAHVVAGIFGPDGYLTAVYHLTRVAGTARDGSYRGVLEVDRLGLPGRYQILAFAIDGSDNYTDPETLFDTVRAKQRTRVTSFNVGPEPAVRGSALTVSGRLERVGLPGWIGYGGQRLTVEFRKAGTSGYVTLGTVTTRADGSFSTARFTAGSQGVWRVRFAGTPLRTPVRSAGDAVALTG